MATSMPSATMDASKTMILARFTAAPNVTTEQYDETIRRLEKSGDWPPEGLEYHVAVKANGNLRVSEIWDSREQFDDFGERLMPVLKTSGSSFRASLRCSRSTTSSGGKSRSGNEQGPDSPRPRQRIWVCLGDSSALLVARRRKDRGAACRTI